MSDSSGSGSGSGSPPSQGDNSNSPPEENTSPPGGNEPPSSDSPPSSSGGSSPPSGGNDSSPPSPSNSSPPPPSDSSSSPPSPSSGSNSSSPSPPSDSGSGSGSGSDSGSGSGSSPPPPPGSGSSQSPPPSNSNSSPPPPQPQSPSNSDSSPPPPEENEEPPSQPPPSPPPSGSASNSGGSSPPTSGNSNSSPPPPAEAIPAPTVSSKSPSPPDGSSKSSPPAQTGSPPRTDTPVTRPSPAAPTRRNPTTSDGDTPSRAANHAPKLNPPSSNSDRSSSSSKSDGSSSSGVIVGATIAGVVLISLFAIFFVVARRRKRRSQAYAPHYGPPPDSFTLRTDGYYYGPPPHTSGVQGHSQEYYSGRQRPPPLNAAGHTFGSNRGNMLSPGGPDSSGLGGKSCFSYEELMEITHGFARENKIGEGGFGAVHKGWLPDGRVVAVKQLKVGSGQGEREFRAEVEIISRVHHRHLVSLVGYCIAEHHRLLVYEFVSNKTLEYHLHEEGLPVMDWSKRLRIAIGAARGLAYLHEDCHPKIIHRDIKSANILVDDAFEAQVADFGLAKLSTDTYTHVSTRVMGTFGYMAPEYAASGKLTDRSDVFSFGVVLLEIVTGRKPVDPTQPLGDESLVEWARPLLIHALETRDISELVDPRLQKRYVEGEMIRVIEAAAACVRHSAPKRPRMVQVLRALDTDGDMPDLSNGVKYGQSTIYDTRQYSSDIQKFRMMAFGSDDGSDYDMYSGEYNSRELRPRSQELTSGELETRAINPNR